MSHYSYFSESKYPQRAVKRMIGFQIFCYRHKYRINAEKFCQRSGISLQELERLELGSASKSGPNWPLIRKVLKGNNLQLGILLQPLGK